MKEIIVDGMDVAGCNFFIEDYQRANNIEGRYEHCKNVCELNGDNYFYCEMNKDCYYKQLQRLKQENEELQTVHKQLKQMIKSKESLLEKAIQENAELKYEIDRQKEIIIYLNNSDILHKTLLQYKTALEIIREKCKRAISDFGLTNDNTWEYCVIIELINKILENSEVTNDRNNN